MKGWTSNATTHIGNARKWSKAVAEPILRLQLGGGGGGDGGEEEGEEGKGEGEAIFL